MKTKASDILRLIAPEFESVSEDKIDLWFQIAKPLVSKKQYGNLYDQALANLTAHLMKMSGLGDDTYGTIPDTMRIGSVSEGNTSVSFNGGAFGSGTVDEELSLTQYGIAFKRIRATCLIPITVSGV